MPETAFQVVILGESEPGTFRVLLRTYPNNGTKTFAAVMNAKRFSEFIALTSADPDEVSGAPAPKKALVLESVELEVPEVFVQFGFALQEAAKR